MIYSIGSAIGREIDNYKIRINNFLNKYLLHFKGTHFVENNSDGSKYPQSLCYVVFWSIIFPTVFLFFEKNRFSLFF